VDLDATAIDEQSIGSIARSRKRAENACPDAALGPANEPVIKRLLGSIDVCAVGPTATATKRMDDPAQHTTIIHTWLATNVGWQQRRDPRPLLIGKPKEISHLTASSPRQ
jgi:hypothetical protein